MANTQKNCQVGKSRVAHISSQAKSQVHLPLRADKIIEAGVFHVHNTREGRQLYESHTGCLLRYSDQHDVERYVNESFDYWFDHYLDSK